MKGFAKFTPKVGRVFSTFLLPPELIWESPMPVVWDIINLSWGPIIFTNYNFHPHVQYCIGIHYHSCSIDKYRYVEVQKYHTFGRLGISCFEKAGFCKTHPKNWESFLHIPSPTWTDWCKICEMLQLWKVRNIPFWEGRVLKKLTLKVARVSYTFLLPNELIWGYPYARDVKYHLSFRGPIWLTNYNFHPHVLYCITTHYHSCSIDKYRNVKDVKCHNFWRLGISCFEKEGFCKTHCQKLGDFPPHSFSHLCWIEVPPMLGVWNIIYLLGTYQIDKL